MGNSNYSYNQIIDFLFPIWIYSILISFIAGLIFIFITISTERKKPPICCTKISHNHEYNYYSFVKFWFILSIFTTAICLTGWIFLLWGALSFNLKIYFAYYLFEDTNVGIAYGNILGFLLDVIIFFGFPAGTTILSFSTPVFITKLFLKYKVI